MYQTVKRLARKGEEGRFWYGIAREAIRRGADLYGQDFDVSCRVAATLSPRVSVRRNMRLLGMWMRNEPWPPDVYRSKRALVELAVAGQVSGPKVTAFYKNLVGDENPIVLDVWMGVALLERDQTWTARRREAACGAIHRVACEWGWTNAQVQAACWCGQYTATRGKLPPTFTLDDITGKYKGQRHARGEGAA